MNNSNKYHIDTLTQTLCTVVCVCVCVYVCDTEAFDRPVQGVTFALNCVVIQTFRKTPEEGGRGKEERGAHEHTDPSQPVPRQPCVHVYPALYKRILACIC